ncbi:MAG TPA: SRPBCC family protein [Miltoncostaeaceae bacterium]|nr:SRPBCC family protein [Miltoncostaeaceae bacterium]
MSSRTADIAAPPERVWSLLVDPAERLRWVDELVATVPDRPPTGVGDEFVLKIREGGNVVDYAGEVTVFEPLRRYAVRMRRGPLEIGLDHRLEDLGDGRTRIVVDVTTGSSNRLLRLGGSLFAGAAARVLGIQLERLQEVAEQDA